MATTQKRTPSTRTATRKTAATGAASTSSRTSAARTVSAKSPAPRGAKPATSGRVKPAATSSPVRKAAAASAASAQRSKTRAATESRTPAPTAKKTAAPTTSAAKKTATRPAKDAAPAKPLAKTAAKAAATKNKSPKVKARAARILDAYERLRLLVLGALDDLKAKDVVEIDMRGKSSVTDLLVIASGTSTRHVKSIADEVVKKAKQASLPPIGVEGEREAEWVLVDLGDVIVHVMMPRAREFYALERLWTVGDAHPPILQG